MQNYDDVIKIIKSHINSYETVDKNDETYLNFLTNILQILEHHNINITKISNLNDFKKYLDDVFHIVKLAISRYEYQIKKEIKRSASSYEKIFRTIKKLFEFLLNLLFLENQHIIEKYFITPDNNFSLEYDNLLEFYISEAKNITDNFHIVKESNKNTIYYHEYFAEENDIEKVEIKIKSLFKVAEFSDTSKSISDNNSNEIHYDNLFSKYLQMNSNVESFYLNKKYKKSGKSNKTNSSYGNRLNYLEINDDQKTEYVSLSNNYDDLDDNLSYFVNKNYLQESNNFSKFKKTNTLNKFSNIYQSRVLAKENLELTTLYKKPDLKIFRKFFKEVIVTDNEPIYNKLFIFSLLTGIKYQDIFTNILIKDKSKFSLSTNHIVYKSDFKFANSNDLLDELNEYNYKKSGIQIEVDNIVINCYKDLKEELITFIRTEKKFMEEISKLSVDENSVDQTLDFDNNENFHKYLNEFISLKLYKNLKKEEIDKLKEDLNTLLNSILSDLTQRYKKYLKNITSNYSHTIKLSISVISDLIYKYYKEFYSTSNLHLYFMKNLKFHEHSKLSYYTAKESHFYQDTWLIDFHGKVLDSTKDLKSKFHIEETNRNKIINTNDTKIGSPFNFSPNKMHEYFNFLNHQSINNNPYIRDSIIMLTIRYILSITLATRDNSKSANLRNIDKVINIWLIQEKNRNNKVAQRIVPLTSLTLEVIKIFEKIRCKYDTKIQVPFFIYQGKDRLDYVEIKNTKDIKDFFKFYKINIDQKFLNIPTNIGRHIATYQAVECRNINQEYLDAFLNHYNNGSADQGIYSSFNNPKYSEELIKFIENIENIYIKNIKEVLEYDRSK